MKLRGYTHPMSGTGRPSVAATEARASPTNFMIPLRKVVKDGHISSIPLPFPPPYTICTAIQYPSYAPVCTACDHPGTCGLGGLPTKRATLVSLNPTYRHILADLLAALSNLHPCIPCPPPNWPTSFYSRDEVLA